VEWWRSGVRFSFLGGGREGWGRLFIWVRGEGRLFHAFLSPASLATVVTPTTTTHTHVHDSRSAWRGGEVRPLPNLTLKEMEKNGKFLPGVCRKKRNRLRRNGTGVSGVTTKTQATKLLQPGTAPTGHLAGVCSRMGKQSEEARTTAWVRPSAHESKSLTVSFPSRSLIVPKPRIRRSWYVMFSLPMVPAFLLWRLPPPRGMVGGWGWGGRRD
jgi:hypothetical protein